MELGIKDTLKTIRSIGLYMRGLEIKLSAYLNDPVNGPEMVVTKVFSGREISFELELAIRENNYIELTGYDIMLPKIYPPIIHQSNNGISSTDLENRMKAIDWSRHPGNSYDRQGNIEWLKMDKVMTDLEKFTGSHDDADSERFRELSGITDSLMAKYLIGTPLATAIMLSLPYYRSTFYDLYPFPSTVHATNAVSQVLDRTYLKNMEFQEQLKNAAENSPAANYKPGLQR
jgi:hypothetical protein